VSDFYGRMVAGGVPFLRHPVVQGGLVVEFSVKGGANPGGSSVAVVAQHLAKTTDTVADVAQCAPGVVEVIGPAGIAFDTAV